MTEFFSVFNFVPEATCRYGQQCWGPWGRREAPHAPAPAHDPPQGAVSPGQDPSQGFRSVIGLRPGGVWSLGSFSFAMLGSWMSCTPTPSGF